MARKGIDNTSKRAVQAYEWYCDLKPLKRYREYIRKQRQAGKAEIKRERKEVGK